MRKLKKFLITLVLLVLLAGGAFFYLFQRGAFGLDDYVVRQVVAITQTYLVPQVHFGSFEYTMPATIELRDVHFTAPDSTEVVRASSLKLTLAETPMFGRPIVIERIDIKDAVLRLIRPSPNERLSTAVFKGLVPFVRTDNIRNQDKVEEQLRLSSILQIREISITDASVEYDESAGEAPMLLSELDFTLNLDRESDQALSGWYKVDIDLDRAPVFDLDIDGRLNLDTLHAEVAALRVRLDLNNQTYSSLPPRLQTLARAYDAIGKLELHLSGSIEGSDPIASKIELGLWIDELNAAVGDFRLPIHEGRFEFTLSERQLTLTRGFLDLLGGAINLTQLDANLAEPAMPAQAVWEAQNLDLQALMRTKVTEGKPPKVAGKLSTKGQATIDIATGLPSIKGGGEVTIVEGRLVNLPMVQGLVNVLDVGSTMNGGGANNDTATLFFELTPDNIKLTELDLRAQVIAARGAGTLTYGGIVDALVNAGPLEKLQSVLGPIGKLMGKLTDKLAKYHISGPIGDVKVAVKPLGL